MKNIVFYKSSIDMSEIKENSIDLIITSPPYFNIKDYSKDGKQDKKHSNKEIEDLGNLESYKEYINKLLLVWKECQRILKPNGKLCINVPLMPMLKKHMNTHHNRHIFDIQSDIQHSIINNTDFHLLDLYIWKRKNSTKKLIFGSYPFPANFYAQNSVEFITVYAKDGKPENGRGEEIKNLSKLSQSEWIEYTNQIWNIAIPNKKDSAFGKHSAIMPEEIVKRLVRMFSFVNDVVLDPFTGSGTTLKVAYENGRNFIGYEIYNNYNEIIKTKISVAKSNMPEQYNKFLLSEGINSYEN